MLIACNHCAYKLIMLAFPTNISCWRSLTVYTGTLTLQVPKSTVVRMSDATQLLFRFFLFALVHSVFAMPSLKKRITGSSKHLFRFYRLYYNLISLVLCGWLLVTSRGSAVLYVVPGGWSLALYTAQLVFLLILFSCLRQTGIAVFLGISREPAGPADGARLITGGWYRVVRHPLYLFSLLFLLCNPVVSTFGLLFTLLTAAYFLFGARLEENRLIAEFGDSYRDYQRAVPFILPRISRFHRN